MRFVKKGTIRLSWPAVHNRYGHGRPLTSIEHHLYREIAAAYGRGEQAAPQTDRFDLQGGSGLMFAGGIAHPDGTGGMSANPMPIDRSGGQSVFFDREPCEYAPELFARISAREQPDYLVCCYESYPLTDKINAALSMQKALQLNSALTFSIADAGPLGSIMAVDWAEVVRRCVWVACLEQAADPQEPDFASVYTRADAIAAFQLSPHAGELRVAAYGIAQRDELPSGGLTVSELAEDACGLIDDTLRTCGVDAAETTILTQAVAPGYVDRMRQRYERVLCEPDNRNLATAAPYYGLASFRASGATRFALLHMAEPARGVGCILVERVPSARLQG
ncbi:hypothetical protein [Paenibacillus elgii]|uniref:hypothetical protein n=1 Tax=Paenibacillus elgii TaxID=189691 RepID=UPI00203ABAD6|nr:hypothetical protein [Paenibacillus elgii]MCM3272185.1 hypothetical protein [Paenibacillus elgii]